MSNGAMVTFNDPRRFGSMKLVRAAVEHDRSEIVSMSCAEISYQVVKGFLNDYLLIYFSPRLHSKVSNASR